MAQVTIYLSRELHERVRAAALPVSEICQRALVAELADVSHRHVSKPIAGQLTINTNRRQ
jgi:post-segregation antitoxin (ccd killing protein)